MTTKYYFQKQIAEIFGLGNPLNRRFPGYQESVKNRTISFNYGDNGVTFEQLQKLSQLLGTTHINFEGRTEEIFYSEVTRDTEHTGEIYASQVIFPED